MDIEKLALRHLRRNKTFTIAVLQNNQTDIDYQTGEISRQYNFALYRDALIFTTHEKRDFTYDLSFIASNKNFTYGGFFDLSTRLIIIPRAPDFEIKQNDFILFNNKKHKIKDLYNPPDAAPVALLINTLEGIDCYDTRISTLLLQDWEGVAYIKFALEELINKINLTVFENDVPSTFMLWPCCGDSFASALRTLYHPSGVGTLFVNTGFTQFDYAAYGRNGGLSDLGDLTESKSLSTNYNLNQLDADDFHISFFGCNLTRGTGTIFNSPLITVTSTLQTEVDGIILNPTTIGTGHFLINGSAMDSTEIYINGVLDVASSSVRTNLLSGIPTLYNAAKPLFNVVTFGPALTAAQITKLYACLHTFNTHLGRLT